MDAVAASPSAQARDRKAALLAPLTSLRFFAALAIVLYHSLRNQDYAFLASGVTFFYILSGFVLTYVHPVLDGAAPRARFWVMRFARIWPLHLFTFLVVLFTQPFGSTPYKHFYFESTLNVLLLQCWVPVLRVAQSFNFVSWSLSVEMFFYFSFPFLLPLVSRAPWKTLGATLLLYLLLAGAGLHLPDVSSPGAISYTAFVSFFPPLHLYQFVLGMVLAVWWRRSPSTWSFARGSALEIALMACLFVFMPCSENVSLLLLRGYTGYYADHQLASFLYAPLFAAIIYLFAFQSGLISRLLSHAWLVYLGEISFSIYMVHTITLELVRRYTAGISPFGYWALVTAGIAGASALLYGLLEKPARKWIVRGFDSLAARRKPTPSSR
jgi:peptidoglycan/LPS O-acetylase OafA/YrhL